MKWVRRIFDFYLDASIHIALAVYALIQVTGITLNISIGQHLSFFSFFATICCYNFIKYGVEAEKYVVVANRYHKNIQFFSLIALVAGVYHSYFLTKETWVGIAVLIGFTGIYALPVLPKSKNLRSLGGLKIFIVAIVWSGVTVFLPLIDLGMAISWDMWMEGIQRFVFVLILLIPFEIRDLLYDKPELKTLPQRFGVTKTKFFGSFAILVFFFLTYLKDDISQIEGIVKGIIFLLMGIVMYITKRNQSKYFASFWVEGISIFWWGIMVIIPYSY